jgi:tRNA threonylcarbamoyladenosine biosynthesis protein TsaB
LKLLAIDASTASCSAALYIDGATTQRLCTQPNQHTERLLPMMHELLSEAGLSPRALDACAFGAGPGSFTGVRIACGAAQGLAYGANLPIVPVGTLLALAAAAGTDKVVAVLDARMGEIYHAAYVRQAAGPATPAWHCVSPPRVCAAALAPALAGQGWFGAGSGFASFGEELGARYAGALVGVDATLEPRAAQIALLAAAAYARGEYVAPELAAPIYLRDKVALTTTEQAAKRSSSAHQPPKRSSTEAEPHASSAHEPVPPRAQRIKP